MSTPAAPAAGAARPITGGFRNLHLLLELVRRDFSMRFTGSALGVAWAVLQPLSLVVLYWFVFTRIFKMGKAGLGALPEGMAGGSQGYVYFLICGLIAWLGFNEGVIRGATSIVDNAALVRKLTFRSELLVLVPNISAILFEVIALTLFTLYLALQGGSLWSLWLLPFALVIQLALQAGLSWILAATHVFFRDVVQILGFALSVLFYLSPVLYPTTFWPPAAAKILAWNPLTPLLGLFRSAVLAAPLPSFASIVFLLIVALGVLAFGLGFFRRAQASLADLI
ncbi:MAG: ABC transporter permease [Thermoanaerobaculia bacterium]